MILRFLKDQRGNIAVEFGLLAPVFALLLVGIVDYGLAAREKALMQSAARAGLQAVLTSSSATAAAETAAQAVAPDADIEVETECVCPDGTSVVCTNYCAVGNRRKMVTVTASTTYPLVFGHWPGFGSTLALSASARARVE